MLSSSRGSRIAKPLRQLQCCPPESHLVPQAKWGQNRIDYFYLLLRGGDQAGLSSSPCATTRARPRRLLEEEGHGSSWREELPSLGQDLRRQSQPSSARGKVEERLHSPPRHPFPHWWAWLPLVCLAFCFSESSRPNTWQGAPFSVPPLLYATAAPPILASSLSRFPHANGACLFPEA